MRKTNWRGMQDGPKFGMRRVITAGAWRLLLAAAVLLISAYGDDAEAGDLDAVIRAGKLRHIGVRYANFVISANAGLDVELVRAFAEHLGVQYEFVASSWSQIIADLSGQSGPRQRHRAGAFDLQNDHRRSGREHSVHIRSGQGNHL